MGRDASESRPDICHQCLLTLQDSVLNKAGMLRIFIHTSQNVLIEVNPKLRVPRTFKRFGSMIVQLLDKRKIRSHSGEDWLMKVIKNPITDHLPTGAHIFGTSVTGTLVDPLDFVEVLNENTDANKNVDSFVFVFGAFAHGHLNLDYIETMLSFSQYPLSGSVACGKLMNAFEEVWKLH
ncbi:uncharacterized protein [Blastocystis hominis]|uniref:Ribosomal RNA small subunit methyltransferase NEP1 n=1 Tax=Blastocystis hominis TaxID=12968 RepID=D8LYI7_BLAHO|nr:uncharacterized protein [Blastocystis hominis]CBK20642.2 unnamed protein product [Blastocystis hominis]|eukprot:XP_012894690.1 uncharacterized protein [Blastocystis hominis]